MANVFRAAWLALLGLAGCALPPIELAHPVRFEGNQALAEDGLRAVVARHVARHPADPGALDAAVRALEAEYARHGYADAQIRATAEADGVLVFAISEGRAWRLVALAVTGASAIPADELVALYGREVWSDGRVVEAPFEPGDPFDPPRLERWALSVLARYVDAGWLDARLDPPVLERDEAHGSVQVTLPIAQEGPRYRLRGFELPEAVRSLLGAAAPEPPAAEYCTRAAAETYAAAIVRTLRRQGHPEPEIRVGVKRHPPEAAATLTFTVQAGAPRTVESVVVRGNRRVPTAAILDRIPLAPGERFDGDAEQRGIAALAGTGEFARVGVDYEDLPDGRVRLVVSAEETRGLVLRGAHYYHPFQHLGYGLVVEGRDALGECRDLIGTVKVDDRGYRFGLRGLQSRLFDEETSLLVGGDFFYSERPAFTDRGAGGLVEVRRYLSPGMTAALGFALLEHFRTTFDAAATTDVGRDYTEGRIGIELAHDLRDSAHLPTRGQRAFVRAERLDEALGADVEFTRLRAGAGIWLPLHEDLVGSLAVESGWLWPSAGSRGVPVPERFFLGGHDTVRSFREARLGPRDPSGALRGGEFRNLARGELGWRVAGPLELFGFADAGNLGAEVGDWTWSHLRWALGFGARLNSRELTPVSVTAAWNPDRRPGEDEWVVDFAAGVMF